VDFRQLRPGPAGPTTPLSHPLSYFGCPTISYQLLYHSKRCQRPFVSSTGRESFTRSHDPTPPRWTTAELRPRFYSDKIRLGEPIKDSAGTHEHVGGDEQIPSGDDEDDAPAIKWVTTTR
jgi:hypothetical protein